ncbi:MAG: P1 family peptidase [Rhizobiales bacterium]|nr:P1 family peptidase [Hyphomicrobiales bacterium]MBI3673429.1 P1 family peptidase [Hyphomicrobiales bacterium]
MAGRRNLITDVEGVLVGNAEDRRLATGVTVIVANPAMVAAADIRGGAPGTRETPTLAPENLVTEIHSIVLAGGSVFGLDAASAVTWELAKRGVGFRFGAQAWPCPVVPAAILFDLATGADKAWGAEPPYARLGRDALATAGRGFALGCRGAGTGAIAGALKGGLGSASSTWNGFTVGALVAVNSVGSCIDGATGLPWSIGSAVGDEMGPCEPLPSSVSITLALSKLDRLPEFARPGANTTIAVVATDARLDKAEALRLAIMAGDGLARAIRPAHTPFDGDTVFAAATGRRELGSNRPLDLARLGGLAAETLARAIGRAIWEAEPLGSLPSYRSATDR